MLLDGRTAEPRVLPQPVRNSDCVDASGRPPCRLVATAMDFAMMPATERHNKLIADLATERPWLGKAKMVRVGWHTTANQAGLLDDEPHVLAVAQSARFGMA